MKKNNFIKRNKSYSMGNNENFSGREKENVLLALNEFTDAYKQNTKVTQAVIASMKEYQLQTDGLLNKTGETLATINESLEHIKERSWEPQTSSKENQQLSQKLATIISLLQNHQPQVIHQHRFSKLTWVAAGLFLVVSFLVAALYINHSKLENYIASDTKYRLLKLDTTNLALQKILWKADSMAHNQNNLRDTVLYQEAINQTNRERLQKAERLKREATELEKAAGRR